MDGVDLAFVSELFSKLGELFDVELESMLVGVAGIVTVLRLAVAGGDVELSFALATS